MFNKAIRRHKVSKLYAGGEGSGCRGPNCGRPKSAESPANLRDADYMSRAVRYASNLSDKGSIAKMATKQIDIHDIDSTKIMVIDGLQPENATESDHAWVKNVWENDPFKDVFFKAGLTLDDYTHTLKLLENWGDEANPQLQMLSQKVISGNIKDPETKALAVQAAITQAALRQESHGKNTITLYRGIDGSFGQMIKSAITGKQSITLKMQGADSWTTDKAVAKGFGGTILKVNVPIRYAIASYHSSKTLADWDEKEVIIAFPGNKVTIHPRNARATAEFDSDSTEVHAARSRILRLTDDRNVNWIRSQRKVAAGGAGSGCHGPNCGKKKKWKNMNDEEKHTVAFQDRRQKSLYGPAHTQEIQKHKELQKHQPPAKVSKLDKVAEKFAKLYQQQLFTSKRRTLTAFTDGPSGYIVSEPLLKKRPPSLKEDAADDADQQAAPREALWYQLAKNNMTPTSTASPRAVNSYDVGVMV